MPAEPPTPSEAPSRFAVQTTQRGTTTTVAPEGEMDIATVDVVRTALAATAGPLVLDLTRVTFLDTSGLRLIVEQDRDAKAAGRPFTLVAGPEEVQRLFDIAGLRDRLPFAPPAEGPAGAPAGAGG
jgi:anti-sigma B factor antagonist